MKFLLEIFDMSDCPANEGAAESANGGAENKGGAAESANEGANEGAESSIKVIAEGGFCDGALRLSYLFDGARYSMKLDGESIEHVRSGDTCMSLVFKAGERTLCSISDGVRRGGFYIFTRSLDVEFSDGGARALIEYFAADMGGVTVKKISARAIK